MGRDQVRQKLSGKGAEFRKLGVRSLGVFGSYATGLAESESDIDFLVEFEPEKKTFDNYSDLKFLLEKLFQKEIDLVVKEAVRPELKESILAEVEYVQEL